jgi:serine O-acetyltransferase
MHYEQYEVNDSVINIPIVDNYKDCLKLIKSDMFRARRRPISTWYVIKSVFIPFNNTTLLWFRLSQHLKGFFYPLCRYQFARVSRKYNVDLSPRTKVGYGFYIGHGTCMVINKRTVIGNNVNLSQFLNIGSVDKKPAIIGDNVYIGPNVCLVEHVKIGSNSTIGAGAVVTKDVPDNATVAGVPAKVLHYDKPGRLVCYRYKI